MSSFSGLSVALSSLHAQRTRMEISNQNISNINTEGYTRQRVDHEALNPQMKASMHSRPRDVGDGVKVSQITRMMDQFQLDRMRTTDATAGYYSRVNDALNEIEVRFNEPGDDGLTAQMGDFYAAWGDVANNPGEAAPRVALIEEARKITSALNQAAAEVKTQFDQTKQRGEAMVTDMNGAIEGIAKINEELRIADIIGAPGSELRDERDLLINKLARFADVDVELHKNAQGEYDGQVDIFIGTGTSKTQVVDGKETGSVTFVGGATIAAASELQATPADSTTAAAVTLSEKGGEMSGLLNVLNETLPDLMSKYDEVAKSLADTVNGQQADGFGLDKIPPTGTDTGKTMFTGAPASPATNPATYDPPTAATLRIADNFEAKDIAASSTAGEPFDGSNAQTISNLATAADGPIATWQTLVGEIAVQASSARSQAKTTDVQLNDARAMLESSVGVDIDEEMTNMLTSQRAYEASSRMMTAVDQMLDVIINRMGRVGL